MNDGDLKRIIGAWSAFAALLVVIGPGGWMQTTVLSVFVLVCPGTAWSRHLRMEHAMDTLAVGVGISVAVGALVAEILALTSWWHPAVAFALLVFVTVMGLALPVRQGQDRTPQTDQLDQTRT